VLRVVVLSGAGIGIGWLFWQFEKAEREAKRMGFGKGVGQEVADRVAAKMDGRPEWLRRLHKRWNAAGRRGNQILNGSKE
jgi:hypothetical protein